MMGYLPEVVAKREQVGPATGINTAMGFVGSLIAPWLFGLFLDAGNQSQSLVSGRLPDAGGLRGGGDRRHGLLPAIDETRDVGGRCAKTGHRRQNPSPAGMA